MVRQRAVSWCQSLRLRRDVRGIQPECERLWKEKVGVRLGERDAVAVSKFRRLERFPNKSMESKRNRGPSTLHAHVRSREGLPEPWPEVDRSHE